MNNFETLVVGSVCISNNPTANIENLMASGIVVIEKLPNGFKFRRIHLSHNGETFFLTMDALNKSNWIVAPINTQIRLF